MTERDESYENGDDAPEPAAGPRTHAAGESRGPAAGGDDRKPRRFGRRRRVCIMCADHIRVVDYKNVGFLRRFVSELDPNLLDPFRVMPLEPMFPAELAMKKIEVGVHFGKGFP